MSYQKDKLFNEATNAINLAVVHAEMVQHQRQAQRDALERLAWEAQRAMNDYATALAQFEKDVADDAGRLADAEIAAGKTPF